MVIINGSEWDYHQRYHMVINLVMIKSIHIQ